MSQDILNAVQGILLADADVVALVVARAFIAEIPKAQAEDMPRKLILIRRVPGAPVSGTGGYLNLERAGIEVLCHGETPYEADVLYQTVRETLKQALRQLKEGVLIHGLDPTGSPQSLRYSDTLWPYVSSQWNLLASESAAA